MNPNDPYTPSEQPQEPATPVQPEQSQPVGQIPQPTQPVQQPAYVPPQQDQPATDSQNPGKALGIAGFILAFIFPLVGLILSIVALVKSKKAGLRNGLALAGIILSSVFFVMSAILLAVTIMGYMGIQERANSQSAANNALNVVKMAEMYNMENSDSSTDQPTSRYPKTPADIASMVQDVTFVKSPILFAPNDASVIEFYACGDQTGNKIGYWDAAERDVKYLYAGTASDSSTDCTFVAGK